MKPTYKNLPLVLSALAFLFLPIFAFAQDAAAAAADSTGNLTADNLIQWVTPILVPLLIAGVKKLLPSIPSMFLPLIAPVLGVLLGLIQQVASGHAQNLWVAAGLGLLGVAVREVKEALKPAANGGWPDKTPTD